MGCNCWGMLPICAYLLVDMHVLGCFLCGAHVLLEVGCSLLSFLHVLGVIVCAAQLVVLYALGDVVFLCCSCVVGDVGYSAHFSVYPDGGPWRCFPSVGEFLHVFYFCFV